MVLWQSPDTPVMSGFHVNAWLRVCSSRALSRLRALFRVVAWCSDPGTHVLSFGFVSGFGHLRSVLSLCVSVWSRVRSSVHMCFVLLHTVLVFIGCVHSCCHVLCEHVAYEFLAMCLCFCFV